MDRVEGNQQKRGLSVEDFMGEGLMKEGVEGADGLLLRPPRVAFDGAAINGRR